MSYLPHADLPRVHSRSRRQGRGYLRAGAGGLALPVLRLAAQAKPGWTLLYHYGINTGPVVLACENYRSGLLWRLTRCCPYIFTGLRRVGFANGWL